MAAEKQQIKLEEDSVAVRALMDSMGEGLIAVDANGMITAVNPYTLNSLGYREDELLGQWFSGVIVAVDQHREPLDHLMRPIVRALTVGEAVSDYTYYLRKDGTMMPVFLTVAPLLIEGRPSGVIELFRDITTDRQLDLAKDEFVSLASHQLRTPATGVKAILSMLMNGDFCPLNDKQRRYLGKAIDGNNRQIKIIEDILNAARIDSGKMELEFERFELSELIRDVLVEHAESFTARQQTVNYRANEHLVIWGDANKLRMALDNLIGNASKYTPVEGDVTIEVTTTDNDLVISISDTGVGIAADDLSQLFAKFTRLENELSDHVGGTGIGLYLAKNIVELHRGTISVESRLGEGSTFRIQLPLKLG